MHPNVRRWQARGGGRPRQGGGHCAAEIGIRQQAGELRSSLSPSAADQTLDLLIGRDAEGPNTGLGLRRVVGERQNRYPRFAGDRRDRGSFDGRQRTEYHAVAVGGGRFCPGRGSRGGSGGVKNIQRYAATIL